MNNNVVKYYNIADMSLAIDMWQELPVYERLELFKTKSLSDDGITVRVHTSPKKEKNGLKFLTQSDYYSLYTDGEYNYRFYTDGLEKGYGEYACTTIKNNGFNFVDCAVFEDKTNAVPSMGYILDMLPVEVLFAQHSRILLHSSYIVHNGKAILFTAKSGTGKSTQARIWNEVCGADVINGDRVIIGKGNDGVWYAYGTPFCGSSDICKNVTAPISAVVVLTQAKENKAIELSKMEAFKRIYSELTLCNADETAAEKATDTVLQLIKEIPVYMLFNTPDKRAVYALKNAMEGDTL